MLQVSVPPVSIAGPSGRIFTSRPSPGANGVLTVLQVPASKVSEAVRAPDYTAAQLDARADRLVTADSRGAAYIFNIRQNRYVCIDRTGHAGTAATFCPHSARLVFVAYADASIRCYDTSKNVAIGLLREHRRWVVVHLCVCGGGGGRGGGTTVGRWPWRQLLLPHGGATGMQQCMALLTHGPSLRKRACSPVRHMEAHWKSDELLSTSVDGVMVWDTKVGTAPQPHDANDGAG